MSVLVNFRMSDHLKTGLDHIADLKHTTKTSIINDLIEKYLRHEYRQYMSDRETFRKVWKEQKTDEKISVNELGDEPLSFISSEEDESYESGGW